MTGFKQHLYEMQTYSPPLEGRSAANQLLLDFNERTSKVGDLVVDAICEFARGEDLQRYPSYGDINERFAAYAGVKAHQVMITNGSDQGIDLVVRASVSAGDKVVIPMPGFAIYEQCTRVENAAPIAVPYRKGEGFPIEQMLEVICQGVKLVIVPAPNNPCGTMVSLKQIKRIADKALIVGANVLIDECYYEYTGQTAAGLIDQYANIVLTRTLSKTWGLPSLRCGFLLSNADNIQQLLKIRGPYDVNQFAVVAAQAALDEPGYVEAYVAEVMERSKPAFENWLQIHQVPFWESHANYIWAFFDRPLDLADFLRSERILVRPKADLNGQTGLRISLGTESETMRLIDALNRFGAS